MSRHLLDKFTIRTCYEIFIPSRFHYFSIFHNLTKSVLLMRFEFNQIGAVISSVTHNISVQYTNQNKIGSFQEFQLMCRIDNSFII
jgi:hypothetical protein